jgi:hypothetical protein
MHRLILKIKTALQRIEQEKGKESKIKCLVAKNLDYIQWDLVLSADWFESNELERLDYLTKEILTDFDMDCMVQFSGIITYESSESNPLIELLTTIQNNNALGKYPDCGGYVLIEPHQEIAKWVIPLNDKITQG